MNRGATQPIEPTEAWIEANGLRHHVLTWNAEGAPAIVLCHGFLDLAWSFHPLAQRLAAAGLRVLALDWRGHGETDWVGAGGYYHFADYVLDLHALMPALRGEAGEVHLVGHSMGGTAAALYAGTHPGALSTLTLIEGLGPPAFTGAAPDKMVAWLESVDRLRARGEKPIRDHIVAPLRDGRPAPAEETRRGGAGQVPAYRHSAPLRDLDDAVKRLRAQTPALPEELARFLAEKATTRSGEGLRWRFDPLHRTTSPLPFARDAFVSFLSRIDAPALIVSGGRGFRTEDHAERVAALRSAREVEIPDVGHMIHWLAPDALAGAILDHVR